MSHRCEAEHCTALVADGMFMCLPHWRMVPRELKMEIYRAWRAILRARRTRKLTRHRIELIVKYRVVARNAIAAVRERETRRELRA